MVVVEGEFKNIVSGCSMMRECTAQSAALRGDFKMKQQILVPAFESPRPCFLHNMSDFDKLKLFLQVSNQKTEADFAFDNSFSRIRSTTTKLSMVPHRSKNYGTDDFELFDGAIQVNEIESNPIISKEPHSSSHGCVSKLSDVTARSAIISTPPVNAASNNLLATHISMQKDSDASNNNNLLRPRKTALRSLVQLLDEELEPENSGKKKVSRNTNKDTGDRLVIPKRSSDHHSAVSVKKAKSKPLPTDSHPSVVSFDMADFSGLEQTCRNAAATIEGLDQFVLHVSSRNNIVVSFLWSSLCSNHSSTSVKFCTPSTQCRNWNCACDRHTRIMQADAELVGALLFLPAMPSTGGDEDDGDDDGALYLLPLCECEGPDIAASKPSSNSSRRLHMPFYCETDVDARWQALLCILRLQSCRKIMFNTQLCLLPIFRHLNRQDVVNFATHDYQSIVDPKMCMHLCDTDAPELSLELEALLVKFNIQTRYDASPDFGRVAKAVSRCGSEMVALLELDEKLSCQLLELGSTKTLQDIEMPIVCLLSEMEALGVLIDIKYLKAVEQQLSDKRDSISQQVAKLLGEEASAPARLGARLNLSSPEQVAELLYDRLKLPPPSSTAGGRHHSTSEEDLMKIRHLHPVIDLVFSYRACCKTLSTYIQGWSPFLCHYDNPAAKELHDRRFNPHHEGDNGDASVYLIHARWNQTGVRTGRLSCSKPNLQNIPRMQSISGLEINMRLAVVARTGFVLVSADYSQMEMRVLAHMCGDPGMLQLFRDAKGDIYRDLACSLFNKPTSESVTDAERTQAKTICLGVVYGMGNEAAAAQLKIDVRAVKAITESFFKLFPQMKAWIQNIKVQAKQCGYIRTLLGRVRHLPDIWSPQPIKSSTAERQAVNSVIQGTASDLMKHAMISVDRTIAASWRNESAINGAGGASQRIRIPKLLMQIHDELIYEVPGQIGPGTQTSECVQRFIDVLQNSLVHDMVTQLGLRVPMKINVKLGVRWGQLQPVS